jgi:large subunit ribosomal protein L5
VSEQDEQATEASDAEAPEATEAAESPNADAPKAEAKPKGSSKSKGAPGKGGTAKGKGAPGKADGYVPRLKTRYREELVQRIMADRGYSNPMQVPRLEKIVVNMGVGDAVREAKLLDAAVEDLQTITGQKVLVTKARKSIAGFKLREGMSIGAKVTLRGDYMWEFLDRLLSIALPRIRDFRGLAPNAFDGHGNYTIGVTEQLIFPEIDYDKVVKVRGMDITVVTTAQTDEEGRALLLALGFPLQGAPAVSQAS